MQTDALMSLNPGVLKFLTSIATKKRGLDVGTQTELAGAAGAGAAGAAPDVAGAAGLEDFFVYMPWTGLVIELFPMRQEQQDEDSTFVSTPSIGEMKNMLRLGARPHVNNHCFQAFITDVRVEVHHNRGFSNRHSVSHIPVYTVWLPADGSLFEVSGESLPPPVKFTPKSTWRPSELLALEMHALGETALEHGFSGDEYTWMPVLDKSCRTRAAADCPAAPQEYPPAELRTSRELPPLWRSVVALPHVKHIPLRGDYTRDAFPYVGRLCDAQQFVFTPVLLADVAATDDDPADGHRKRYRGARDAFLAHMRPFYDLLTAGGDPRAHGWTQRTMQTENGAVCTWDAGLGKRKQSGVPDLSRATLADGRQTEVA